MNLWLRNLPKDIFVCIKVPHIWKTSHITKLPFFPGGSEFLSVQWGDSPSITFSAMEVIGCSTEIWWFLGKKRWEIWVNYYVVLHVTCHPNKKSAIFFRFNLAPKNFWAKYVFFKPKPELGGFGGDSLIEPPVGVAPTSLHFWVQLWYFWTHSPVASAPQKTEPQESQDDHQKNSPLVVNTNSLVKNHAVLKGKGFHFNKYLIFRLYSGSNCWHHFFPDRSPPWAVKTRSVKLLSGPNRDKSAKREPAIGTDQLQLSGLDRCTNPTSDFSQDFLAQLSNQVGPCQL